MARRSRAKRNDRPVEPTPPPTTPPPAPPSRRRDLVVSCGLVATVFAVFGQLATHEFLNYDDPIYVTRNPHVLAGLTWDGIKWAFRSFDFNWHPVTWMTHMLDVQLFGPRAGAHLMVNVALHAANAVILFLLLQRMTGARWRSAIVAALFALHPLHVESVAWISERKDVLSALFFLLTIWFYLDFIRSRSARRMPLMLATFALGMMSKGMVVTLPFVLLLLDYWPLERWSLRDFRPLSRLTIEKWPLFALDVVAVLITVRGQTAAHTVVSTDVVPLATRTANALMSYSTYLGKTVWPAGLAIPYPYRFSYPPSEIAVAALILAGCTATALIGGRKARYLFTGWLWFVGTLLPVIGLVQIGNQSMADRYTYVPLIGIFVAVVWWLGDAVARRAALVKPAAAATVIVIGSLAIASAIQASYWHDSLRLFTHALDVTRDNRIAHETVGNVWLEEHDYRRALAEYLEAERISHTDPIAEFKLGVIYRKLGLQDEAAKHLGAALQLDPRNAEAASALGHVEITRGNTAAAAAAYGRALQLSRTTRNLAFLRLAEGDKAGAIAAFEIALARHPDDPDAEIALAKVLESTGRDSEALRHYEAAIRLEPVSYEAQMNLGVLLVGGDGTAEGMDHFRRAAAILPDSPEPHVYLALALAQSGSMKEAVAEAERANAIDPALANRQFTNATRMPPSDANLRGWIGFLKTKI